MIGWFKALAMPQKIAAVGAVMVLIGAGIAAYVAISNHKTDLLVRTAEDKGALAAENAGNQVTFEQIGDANEAASKIRNDVGYARYCECLRSASKATRQHCKREIADQSVLGDEDNSAQYCAEENGR